MTQDQVDKLTQKLANNEAKKEAEENNYGNYGMPPPGYGNTGGPPPGFQGHPGYHQQPPWAMQNQNQFYAGMFKNWGKL